MPAITPTATRAQLRRRHFAHIHPSVTADRIGEAVERELTSLDNPAAPKPRAASPTPSSMCVKAAASRPSTAPLKS